MEFRHHVEELEFCFAKWKETYLEEPALAVDIAENAVSIAEGLSNLFLAVALALKGSALKIVGRYSEAESSFLKALELLDNRYRAERADVYRRFAYLRVEQRRFDEALSLIDQASELALMMPDHVQATILIARGYLLGEMRNYRAALDAFSQALVMVDPDQDPLAGDITMHNIVVAISLEESLSLEALKSLLRQLDSVRGSKLCKRGTFRLMMKWSEALVDLRFGMNNKALQTLTRLRREFRRQKRPEIELVMISIDLAQANLQSGRKEKCQALLSSAYSTLCEIEGVSLAACESLYDCIDSTTSNAFDIDSLFTARREFLRPDLTSRDKSPQSVITTQYSSD